MSAEQEMRKLLEWMNRRGGLGYDVHARITEVLSHKQKTATIVLPEGYATAQAFAEDCGVELVAGST